MQHSFTTDIAVLKGLNYADILVVLTYGILVDRRFDNFFFLILYMQVKKFSTLPLVYTLKYLR